MERFSLRLFFHKLLKKNFPWKWGVASLIYLLFYYFFILFLVKSVFTTKYKYYIIQKIKLERHNEELGLLKRSTSWLHPQEA